MSFLQWPHKTSTKIKKAKNLWGVLWYLYGVGSMAPHLGGLLESFTELSLDQSVSSCGVLSMTPNWVDVADSRVECATCRVNDGSVPYSSG